MVDVIVAATLILILSPFLAIVAILIKATSKGPVLYRQTRLMQGGREFTMYKFRTMQRDADRMLDKVFHLNHASGPLFKARRDPRITPLGKILRRTYIDELPQLVNILRGELSLVGPRPCLPAEARSMDGQIKFRFTVPQGLTGPWQVNGHHRLTFEEQLRVEREYIESWSPWLDICIIARTIPLAIRLSGI